MKGLVAKLALYLFHCICKLKLCSRTNGGKKKVIVPCFNLCILNGKRNLHIFSHRAYTR